MDQALSAQARTLHKFQDLLQTHGLRAALGELLLETDYRFIAIFRFDGERARSVVFYDRENPDVTGTDEAPASSTYCCYVRDTRGAFVTANSLLDERLTGHVKREQVQGYCGVPVMTPEGEILGTLCHYDVVPRDSSQIDLALMCEVASAIERGRHLPPYPPAP